MTVQEVTHGSIFVIRKNCRHPQLRTTVKWHMHPIPPSKRTYYLLVVVQSQKCLEWSLSVCYDLCKKGMLNDAQVLLGKITTPVGRAPGVQDMGEGRLHLIPLRPH